MTREQRGLLEGLAYSSRYYGGETQAAITAALGTCGNCAHSNDDQSLLPSLNTYCTRRFGFYNGKLMERTSRCEKWQAQS